MSAELNEVFDQEIKSRICNDILRALPDWFGNEAAIIDYSNKVKDMSFCSAFADERPVGFAAIKDHNPYTAEVCVMGILSGYHRRGIGKKLICWCEEYCLENKQEFLTVKTLDGSRESKSYEKTRLFYFALGFKPLEVFPYYWDKDNPCLFLAKHISADRE